MLDLLLALLLLAVVPASAGTVRTDCNISAAKLSVPANQTALVPPTSGPHFIGLGVGVQNYTCNATSLTYTNVGAVAELLDISCLYGTAEFDTIPLEAFKAWSNAPSNLTAQEVITVLGTTPLVLGQHYFITNGSTLSPKWDFTSDAAQGNAEAFVVAATTGSIPSPAGKNDITWTALENVQGELADMVFRVQTVGGQPPASCTAGTPDISVKYTAQYWFFGGSINPQQRSGKYTSDYFGWLWGASH